MEGATALAVSVLRGVRCHRDRSGHEIKLPPGSTGGAGLGFFFNPTSLDIAVTIDTCVLMRNEGRTLVVRYNRAVLVE